MIYNLILTKGSHEVLTAMPEDFVLPDTDTDVEILTYEGDTPPLGKFWVDGEYKTAWEIASAEIKLNAIRSERTSKLINTDYLVTRHRDQEAILIPTTLSPTQMNQLLAYRQALRDFTDTADLSVDNLESIVWPVAPDFI